MAPSKSVTVEEASPSPPPLPNEPAPSTAETVDQPIVSLGDEESDAESDDSNEEWDPSAERLPGGSTKEKAKGKAADVQGQAVDGATQGDDQPWQAVWAPEQNAWYFWNKVTGAVTWTNPLETPSTTAPPPPAPPPLPSGPPPSSQPTDATFGVPADIDPDLAHLLPPSQRGFSAAPPGTGAQSALFNARTGRFTANDYAYTVDHLDEYNRAKRMNSHYFDVDAWERQKAEEHAKRRRDEEMGITSQKKTTRKDMERYRKKAAEKKHRSQAWLRD